MKRIVEVCTSGKNKQTNKTSLLCICWVLEHGGSVLKEKRKIRRKEKLQLCRSSESDLHHLLSDARSIAKNFIYVTCFAKMCLKSLRYGKKSARLTNLFMNLLY